MIIDCALYRDGRRQQEGVLTLDQAAALHRDGSDGFAWLGTFEPVPEELEDIRKSFGLHELAVEDVKSFHLRPKVEQYGQDVELVILRTARYDDDREEVDFGEISVFIAPTFVITVRQGVASELHSARTTLEGHPELLAEGSPAVLWAILDQVIKSYGPVVAELERDIEEVESTVFAGEAAPTERIYFLRREVTNFHRAVHPLLTVLTTIERTNREGPLAPYFHDVHDYLRLISDEVAAQRDLLATILEANMAVIGRADASRGASGPDRRAPDHTRHDLPAPDLRDRLLRAELPVARSADGWPWPVPRPRDRRAGRAARRPVAAPPQRPLPDGALTGHLNPNRVNKIWVVTLRQP